MYWDKNMTPPKWGHKSKSLDGYLGFASGELEHFPTMAMRL